MRLAALETRQAGESLVSMITLGVIVAGLLLSAWLGLLAGAARPVSVPTPEPSLRSPV